MTARTLLSTMTLLEPHLICGRVVLSLHLHLLCGTLGARWMGARGGLQIYPQVLIQLPMATYLCAPGIVMDHGLPQALVVQLTTTMVRLRENLLDFWLLLHAIGRLLSGFRN